ncbi:MAG TPA: hypothetical protein VGZ27_10480 [Vicinamibacterales bacterium]|nr:hypothetical protein [Vicinamibacterales bacterium]
MRNRPPGRGRPPRLASKPKNDAHGASLLIIDDEQPAAVFVPRALIYRLGCRVHIVGNGRHAIERLKEEDYDVIISFEISVLEHEVRRLLTLRSPV